MMGQQHEPMLRAHRFLKGERDDAPLLIPLALPGRETRDFVRFCRRIYPGAPILVPLLDPPLEHETSAALQHLLLEEIAVLIGKMGSLYDLALVPAVLIGHGRGADLAARLVTQFCSKLAVCILLRPTCSVAPIPPGSLNGLTVLIACDAAARDGSEHQLQGVMSASGADVILERVRPRRTPGGFDTAICHVFLKALFPALERILRSQE